MNDSYNRLVKHATNIRKKILRTAHAKKQGHVGGSLSAADILTVLYFEQLDLIEQDSKAFERDRFILSKGHVALGLYCTLAERGFIPEEELFTFDRFGSRLQAHPDMTRLDYLEMSTGSLGQGISVAVGMALGAKYLKQAFYVFTLLGDGESQEGQVWEAAHIAARYKLDNLIVIVDYNALQQFGWREDGRALPPDEQLTEKFLSFGFEVFEVDGHNIEQLSKTISACKYIKNGRPKAIIARTVKGKGVSFMENNDIWHSKAPNDHELALALQELNEGGGLL